MNNIKIKLHSMVDIITNSSTVIYCQCHDNTIETMKGIINTFLKQAGSNKTAEDLYTFKIVADSEYEIERLGDRIDEGEEEIIEFMEQNSIDFTYENWKKMNWDDRDKILRSFLDEIGNGNIKEYDGYGENYNGYDTRDLILIPKSKDKEIINMSQMVKTLFEIDGGRDG